MLRKKQFSSLFYEADSIKLYNNILNMFDKYKNTKNDKIRICMLPHAGHCYSGEVTAKTLASCCMPNTCIILCPNHTGYGKDIAVWDKGAFETPLGTVEIDEEISAYLLKNTVFQSDYEAHIKEHSIEVILPFLQYINPCIKIIPICLRDFEKLGKVAETILDCMLQFPELGLIISSDMNHFATDTENRRKDMLAIQALTALNEKALVQTVIDENISMCGVLGAYVGILVAKGLGCQAAKLIAYDTSASFSGDTEKVVGYAGMIFA